MEDATHMALRARELLAARGVPACIDALQGARRQLADLERQLARAEQRVTWWDRVLFFHTTPDEAQASRLRRARDEARAAADAAQAAWAEAVSGCAGFAPIEIVFRVESLIDEVMRRPEVGRATSASRKTAEAIETLAERVRELWLPGLDLAALVAGLVDDARRRQAAAAPVAPSAFDATLGWAPLGEEELFRRVAQVLETSAAFAASRAKLAREQQQDASWLERLEQARAQVTWSDKLIPGRGERERLVASSEAELARERWESAEALDAMRLDLVRAFAAHPISWLYFALLAAAAALRAAEPREVATLEADADLSMAPSGAARAVVLACLVEVRRACEVAFSGVPAQVWPRGTPSATPPARADGPYRLAGRVVDATIEVDLAEEDEAFFRHLDRCDVRAALTQAVSVATVYGLARLDLARLDIAWLDRLTVWSDTPGERERDRLETRVEVYHRGLAHRGEVAVATVVREAPDHHAMVGLGHALAEATAVAATITTPGGRSSSPMHCPAINKGAAMAAVRAVIAVIQRFFAVRGDRGVWIDDVCRRLWHASGPIAAPAPEAISRYEDIVELLAAALQETALVPLVQRVVALRQQHGEATRAVTAIAARVSFWDKLNFFSDTPDESLRDQWKTHASKLHQDLAGSEAEVHRLIDGAIAAYPPLGIFEELNATLGTFDGIYARSELRTRTHTTRNSKGQVVSTRTETYYVCAIYGVSAARKALAKVTKRILDTFGPLPTPSDALEAWIAREL